MQWMLIAHPCLICTIALPITCGGGVCLLGGGGGRRLDGGEVKGLIPHSCSAPNTCRSPLARTRVIWVSMPHCAASLLLCVFFSNDRSLVRLRRASSFGRRLHSWRVLPFRGSLFFLPLMKPPISRSPHGVFVCRASLAPARSCELLRHGNARNGNQGRSRLFFLGVFARMTCA